MSPIMPMPGSMGRTLASMRHNWGWLLAFGVLQVVLGIAALVFVVEATIATVQINGIIMCIAGGMEMIVGLNSRAWSRFFLWIGAGLLYLAAGAFAIANPILASSALTLILGAVLSAAGIMRLVLAFHMPAGAARTTAFVSAAIALLLGVAIMAGWPANSLFILGSLLGIDLLFYGVGTVGLALRLKSHP